MHFRERKFPMRMSQRTKAPGSKLARIILELSLQEANWTGSEKTDSTMCLLPKFPTNLPEANFPSWEVETSAIPHFTKSHFAESLTITLTLTVTLKAHSHQARLRLSTCVHVCRLASMPIACVRAFMSVDGRRRAWCEWALTLAFGKTGFGEMGFRETGKHRDVW